MKKLLFATLFLSLFFIFPSWVNAELITITGEGEVVLNVLSYQDQLALGVPERQDLTINKLAADVSSDDNFISLKKEEGKMFLSVGEGDNRLDVTNWNEDLVEIEEKADVKRIQISVKDERFAIEQDGVTALTEFPININPKENELSLTTDSGSIFLSVLPKEAAETALRSRFVTRISQNEVEISQKDLGVLAYVIKGEKVIKLLNVVNYSVPVTTHVSTSTGEVLSVDQPTWLRIFGFLLS